MVVMWCKHCGALLGVREPIAEWTSDQESVCPGCGEKVSGQEVPTEDELPATRDTADELPKNEPENAGP